MSVKSRFANQTVHLLVAALILLTSVPMSTSIAVASDDGGDVVQAETPVQKKRLEPGVRLYAVCEPPVVAPGSQAACIVTVLNEDDEDAIDLKLSARLPKGLSLAGGKGRRWNATVEDLAMGESVALELTLDVDDDTTGPLSFEVEARGRDGVRGATTAVVGVGSTDERITTYGGLFEGDDGRIRVHFSPGALKKETKVKTQIHKQGIDPRGRARSKEEHRAPGRTGALLRFSLEAEERATGEAIERFDVPVTLEVDLRGLVPPEGLRAGQHLYLFHIVDPATGEADEVEVAYDAETGLLTAELEHFSEYEIGTVGEGWRPILTPPTTSLFSGAATYSHPIQVPEGRGGVQPGISISYSSRRIDGLIDGSGGQVDGGPIALGWSLGGIIEISRHSHLKGSGTYQLEDDFSLVLNGTSHELKADSGTCGRYWAKDGPGVYAERIHDGCPGETGSDQNETSDYWIVRTSDGTEYRLGYTEGAEVVAQGSKVACVAGEYCSPGGNGLGAIRWRVDEVTDVFGNRMVFTYREKTIDAADNVETERSGVEEIRYNEYGSGQWLSKVVFVYDADNPDDSDYVDLKGIEVYQAGELLREYAFVTKGKGRSVCDYSYKERTLRRIDEFNGDGLASPSVIFEYQEYNNTPNCFPFYRMSAMTNPYGGRVEFSYVSDGRWVNGSPVPEYGFSYRVSEIRTYDLIHAQPARVTYAYGTPCYDQTGTNGRRCKIGNYVGDVGSLAGHDWTEVTAKTYEGAAVNKTRHDYYICDTGGTCDKWRVGREDHTWVYSGAGALLQESESGWTKADTGGTTFAYLHLSKSWDHSGGDVVSAKTRYAYEWSEQGGAQYGNLTHVREYDDADAATPYRTSVTTYNPNSNPNVWIVGKPKEVKVYAGDVGGTLLSWIENYYDYSTSLVTPPMQGLLTKAKQINPLNSSEVVETRYWYDGWGNLTEVRDPLNEPTTIEYDTTHHMFPKKATNAAGHWRRVDYYGVDGVPADTGLFGQVKRVWDSNGTATATSYTYDAFGRLATVVRPGDTLNKPTTAYWYDETTAPDRVVFEYFNEHWLDTLYNTTENWKMHQAYYTYRSKPFRVRPTQESGTTPLHRLFCEAGDACVDGSNDTRKHDTLYTTGGYGGWVADEWQYEGVLGYIWTSSGAGREPLYRCADVGANKLDYYLLVGAGSCSYQHLLGYVEPATEPIRVGVSQREVSGEEGTLDAYTYYDGWGREIQTRGEAEGGQWTVASTEYDALGRAVKG